MDNRNNTQMHHGIEVLKRGEELGSQEVILDLAIVRTGTPDGAVPQSAENS